MKQSIKLPPPPTRAAVALILPLIIALLLTGIINTATGNEAGNLLFLAGLGLGGMLLGLLWYGAQGMGLRGGRPFFASAGFAFLGWILLLLLRFTVDSSDVTSGGVGAAFLYLLLFEAFAVQIWLFGLLFRTLSDWRDPLSAAVLTGLLFGLVGHLFFQEAYHATSLSWLYFAAWGIFYGLIRLRTGSLLGIVIVQTMQSLTAWHILLPNSTSPAGEYIYLYTGMIIWYALLIWRLWPKEEEDYRV